MVDDFVGQLDEIVIVSNETLYICSAQNQKTSEMEWNELVVTASSKLVISGSRVMSFLISLIICGSLAR